MGGDFNIRSFADQNDPPDPNNNPLDNIESYGRILSSKFIDLYAKDRIMKTLLAIAFVFAFQVDVVAAPCKGKNFKVVIHGGSGAGNKPKDFQEKMKLDAAKALQAGFEAAMNGRRAEEVVVEVLSVLEDSPYFNAGRGGNPNKAGFTELDSSIMRGRDRNAGAVAAVRHIKNPIKGAYAIMTKSKHLMFVDRGADKLAEEFGLETVENDYFRPKVSISLSDPNFTSGTVGAVVLDRCGDIAAGTSTGGFATKVPGRVGDSPIIGAGTYAENKSCAVSATGQGEIFIRWNAASDTCALVKYKGWSIEKAAEVVINKVKKAGAKEAGLIVLNQKGKHAWPYHSKGMLRGSISADGEGLVVVTGKPLTFKFGAEQ